MTSTLTRTKDVIQSQSSGLSQYILLSTLMTDETTVVPGYLNEQ